MTRRQRFSYVTVALAIASAATPALADGPIAAVPVSDAILSEIRGTFLPYSTMSSRQLLAMQDTEARSDFRTFGTIAGIIMDNWWADAGASLMTANALR